MSAARGSSECSGETNCFIAFFCSTVLYYFYELEFQLFFCLVRCLPDDIDSSWCCSTFCFYHVAEDNSEDLWLSAKTTRWLCVQLRCSYVEVVHEDMRELFANTSIQVFSFHFLSHFSKGGWGPQKKLQRRSRVAFFLPSFITLRERFATRLHKVKLYSLSSAFFRDQFCGIWSGHSNVAHQSRTYIGADVDTASSCMW